MSPGRGAAEHAWWIRLVPRSLQERILARPQLVRVLDNLGWLLADKAFRLVLSAIVGIVLARYLGPASFGELSFVIAIVALANSLSAFGLNGIVVPRLVRDPSRATTTLATAAMLTLVGSVCAAGILALMIPRLRPDPGESRTLLLLLGATLFFKASEVIKYWFEATVQSRYIVWAENACALAGVIGKLLVVALGASLVAIGWVSLGEAALTAAALLLVMRLRGRPFSLRDASRPLARTLLGESWPLLLSGVAVIAYMRLDVVMLDRMVGSAEVGVYSAASRISEILYIVPTVVVSSFLPSIVRSHQSDPALYLRRMRRLYGGLAWFAAAVSLIMTLLAEPLIRFIYGSEYAAAGPVLAIHLWASIAVFTGAASSQHLILEGLQVLSFWRTLIGLILNFALNLLLIPRMGAQGASIATVISYFFATYSLLFFSKTRPHAIQMALAPFTNPSRLLRQT